MGVFRDPTGSTELGITAQEGMAAKQISTRQAYKYHPVPPRMGGRGGLICVKKS